MSIYAKRLLFALLSIFLWVPAAVGVTIQSPEDFLADGSVFLVVEGEDAELTLADGTRGDPTTGLVVVDKANPIQTINVPGTVKGGLDVLRADANASGGAALFHQLGTGGANTATWQLQFAVPATYYLYAHWSVYNRDTNTNYGNEDSFYVPPAFNKDSRNDWIDFEGVDEFGDPKFGDSNRDGFIDGFATLVNVMSAGEVETHNTTDEDFWDGNFHWVSIPKANDMTADGQFASFFGHGIQYEVTEEEVGQVLDFQISTREQYGVIDSFVFSTNPLLLEDFSQEDADGFFLAPETEAAALMAGDADQDFDFDQIDLVKVQIAAKYLTGQAATWGEGDWNGAPGGEQGSPPPGNGLFDQFDVIAAQQAGIYLTGSYAAIAENGAANDGQTSIGYDAGSGELWVDAPAGVELTSVNIESASGIFTGEPAQNLGGSFDNDGDNNVFKATFGGSFGSISFGNVAASGLSEVFVAGDLSVVGSLAGGGDLGNVDLMYVPEPAALLLFTIGLVLMAVRRVAPQRQHGPV